MDDVKQLCEYEEENEMEDLDIVIFFGVDFNNYDCFFQFFNFFEDD